MLVKDLYIEEKNVVKVNSTDTAGVTLDLLRESGYRCVPVVDESGDYAGMIYKVHLLEFLHVEKGDPGFPIASIAKHKEEFIEEDDTFVKSLKHIKALPFLSVVKEGKLVGILTHNRVMSVMEDSLGLGTGGVNFTVTTIETTGVIEKIGKILKKENIQGLFTLDNGSTLIRRIVFTLERGRTESDVEELKKKLEKAGIRVISVENL